jgi:processive 1,2-diacylglycerol beta-glucosyltransferase
MDKREQADILIFSASYGGGHRRVSYAVERAINTLESKVKTGVIDLFEHISPKINRLNAYAYVTTMRNIPWLYGIAYELTYDLSLNNLLNKMTSRIGLKKLRELTIELKPKVVLSTYPTYGGMISELKRRKEVNIVSTVVITDFVAHSQWIHPLVDQYFVPSDEVRYHLIKKGIPPDTIQITGIPISADFLIPVDKDAVLKQYGLKSDSPVILIMAGIFGMTRGIMEMCQIITELFLGVQTVVLCGRDKKLFDKLSSTYSENTIKPFYGQTDVYKLMHISNLLISKSGGITVSEALAKELPMIIYKPLPGQEYHNAVYLSKTGAGIIANNKKEVKNILTALLTDPQYLNQIKESARIIKKPYAAMDVARSLIEKISLSV